MVGLFRYWESFKLMMTARIVENEARAPLPRVV